MVFLTHSYHGLNVTNGLNQRTLHGLVLVAREGELLHTDAESRLLLLRLVLEPLRKHIAFGDRPQQVAAVPQPRVPKLAQTLIGIPSPPGDSAATMGVVEDHCETPWE